jgi:hypothetical protein
MAEIPLTDECLIAQLRSGARLLVVPMEPQPELSEGFWSWYPPEETFPMVWESGEDVSEDKAILSYCPYRNVLVVRPKLGQHFQDVYRTDEQRCKMIRLQESRYPILSVAAKQVQELTAGEVIAWLGPSRLTHTIEDVERIWNELYPSHPYSGNPWCWIIETERKD